jgi:hypothetical protein
MVLVASLLPPLAPRVQPWLRRTPKGAHPDRRAPASKLFRAHCARKHCHWRKLESESCKPGKQNPAARVWDIVLAAEFSEFGPVTLGDGPVSHLGLPAPASFADPHPACQPPTLTKRPNKTKSTNHRIEIRLESAGQSRQISKLRLVDLVCP